MFHFSYKDTTYEVDEQGFLLDAKFWDENFAEGMARECGLQNLTGEHWDVINHLREVYANWGTCPTIFALCKANGLRPREIVGLEDLGATVAAEDHGAHRRHGGDDTRDGVGGRGPRMNKSVEDRGRGARMARREERRTLSV